MNLPELSARVELSCGLSIGYEGRLACVDGRDEGIVLEGGTHYLLARNGRGKTTLLKTLAGVLNPLGGDYSCEGRCQYLSEDLTFDRELPAKAIFKAFLKKGKYAEAIDLAQTLELDVKKPYGQLSTGNKRKVALLLQSSQCKIKATMFYCSMSRLRVWIHSLEKFFRSVGIITKMAFCA